MNLHNILFFQRLLPSLSPQTRHTRVAIPPAGASAGLLSEPRKDGKCGYFTAAPLPKMKRLAQTRGNEHAGLIAFRRRYILFQYLASSPLTVKLAVHLQGRKTEKRADEKRGRFQRPRFYDEEE